MARRLLKKTVHLAIRPRVVDWSMEPPQPVCLHYLWLGPCRTAAELHIKQLLEDGIRPFLVSHQIRRQSFLPARIVQPLLKLHLKITQERFKIVLPL